MAERSQYQYTPIVGPVWREPVADRLAWLPRGQQPAREFPPNRLGDFARPEFEALYKPEGLQWSASDRYAGQPLPYALVRYWVIDPTPPAVPFNPSLLDWQARGQQPARALDPNRLGDFVRPEYSALYRPDGLEWLPSDRFPGRGLAPNYLGDFQQPAFDSIYKSEGLQWNPRDRYAGTVLARTLRDWTVETPRFQAPPFDPQNLEWVPNGLYPQIPVPPYRLGDFQQPSFGSLYQAAGLEWLPRGVAPRILIEWRLLGDFARPEFEALYKPEGLQWSASDRYAGTALARVHRDWTVETPRFQAPAFDPRNLEWIPSSSYPQISVDTRKIGDFQQPVFGVLYKPEGLQWLASDRYVGRVLGYALSGSQISAPVLLASPPKIGGPGGSGVVIIRYQFQ